MEVTMNNDFLNDIKSYITVFPAMKDISNYHLEMNYYPEKIIVAAAPKIFKKNYHTDEIVLNLKNELALYVAKFKTLFKEEYLKTLYNNLATLKYQDGLNKKDMLGNYMRGLFHSGISTGSYDPRKNTIRVLSKDQQKKIILFLDNPNESYEETMKILLPHELFHVATAVNTVDTYYCGFRQTGKNYDIGEGLNEGYTELLSRRYFNIKPRAYSDNVIIASLIEELIGKEEMEDLYFHTDLPSLIKKMAVFSNIKLTERFIVDIDFYNITGKEEVLHNILLYLINAYYVKLKNDKTINPEDIDNLIKEYQNHVYSQFQQYQYSDLSEQNKAAKK